MASLVLFPDAEAVVIAWTAGKLGAGVKMRTSVPSPRPALGFVKVTRTGGYSANIVTDNAQLTFECWHPSESSASALCQLTRAVVEAMDGELVGTVWVRGVYEIGGPANFPDPESAVPRYQFTKGALLRGTSIIP